MSHLSTPRWSQDVARQISYLSTLQWGQDNIVVNAPLVHSIVGPMHYHNHCQMVNISLVHYEVGANKSPWINAPLIHSKVGPIHHLVNIPLFHCKVGPTYSLHSSNFHNIATRQYITIMEHSKA